MTSLGRVRSAHHGEGNIISLANGFAEVVFDKFKDKDGNWHPNMAVLIGDLWVFKSSWHPVTMLERIPT